jgi:hypothetical protein
MGVRIHKVLGYGLIDVKPDKYDILGDSRFNPDGYFGIDQELANEEDFTQEKYIEYLQKQKAIFEEQCEKNENPENLSCKYEATMDLAIDSHFFQRLKLQGKTWDISKCFAYQSEYGMPNVMCVVGSCFCESHNRYADDIDYYEERIKKPESINYYNVLPQGIYPYEGLYFNKNTGEELHCDIAGYFYLKEVERFERAEIIAKSFGFDNGKHLEESVKPVIPDPIKAICKFAKIFKDDKTILDLIPILYVYWA